MSETYDIIDAIIDRVDSKATLAVESKSLGSVSVGASTFASIEGSVAKTGFTPIGIVGISKSGSNNGDIGLTQFRISDTTANVALRNHTATARTIGVTVYVLYIKS